MAEDKIPKSELKEPKLVTRETKSEKSQKSKSNPVKKRAGWVIPLRIFLIIVFLALATIGGAAAGYVVLGKQDIEGIWDLNTWKHVFDLVFAP